jgi:hypothetical protein
MHLHFTFICFFLDMDSTSETVVTDVVGVEDELSDAAEKALVDGGWVAMC